MTEYEDTIRAHVAIMNLMSCLEIATALHFAAYLAEDHIWQSNAKQWAAPGWPPKWVVGDDDD